MATDVTADLLNSTYWCSLIGLRREVHKNPEPGFKEVRTSGRIREVLQQFAGIPESQMRLSAITGLVIDVKGTGPANPSAPVKCVALRSDLDALTMTEDNDALPYRSVNKGIAHMCGHDGHIATLVGTAIMVQRRADKIPANCTVRFIFQPAEESTPPGTAGFDFKRTGGGGAVPMIDEGCLEGVDEIYGWHNWPAWPMGSLAVKPGALMANVSTFKVIIHGKGGHGSQPHACIDPIVCGAAVVSALQTIVSRSLPSNSNAVVTIGTFQAGERMNVIPDTATLTGTCRDVDAAVFAVLQRRFKEVVTNVCKGFQCTADIDFIVQYPCLMNHEEQVKVVERCGKKLTGPLAVEVTSKNLPMLGGEDFAFFLKERPGAFFFLGTNEATLQGLAAFEGSNGNPRSNCICHGTTFDFNDNILPRAVTMLIRILEDRFGVDLYSQEEILGQSTEPAAKRAKTQ
mmetsp:Transcript_67537/g.162137  ORF Transcript_67537/g.162137 Transcript_67537/m.162137 type:complete len:458 (-) Transcript_67537:19-1392(-)